MREEKDQRPRVSARMPGRTGSAVDQSRGGKPGAPASSTRNIVNSNSASQGMLFKKSFRILWKARLILKDKLNGRSAFCALRAAVWSNGANTSAASTPSNRRSDAKCSF